MLQGAPQSSRRAQRHLPELGDPATYTPHMHGLRSYSTSRASEAHSRLTALRPTPVAPSPGLPWHPHPQRTKLLLKSLLSSQSQSLGALWKDTPPLQLRTRTLSTHLKGQRYHTFHRLTQNEVLAALPPVPRLQASCWLPRNHAYSRAGLPTYSPTYLRPSSQDYLKSKRAHSAPGMPCAVTRMALIMGFQNLEVHLVPSLLCLLRISPNSNRNFVDALALQLTIYAK